LGILNTVAGSFWNGFSIFWFRIFSWSVRGFQFFFMAFFLTSSCYKAFAILWTCWLVLLFVVVVYRQLVFEILVWNSLKNIWMSKLTCPICVKLTRKILFLWLSLYSFWTMKNHMMIVRSLFFFRFCVFIVIILSRQLLVIVIIIPMVTIIIIIIIIILEPFIF